MRRGKGITWLCAILGLLFLVSTVRLRESISQQRLEMKLDTIDPIADNEITTHLRIPTAALFAFRSLIINYLWIRADDLKNEGQYFDALPLRRMICALQPNIAAVWKHQAWDMAYNISVGLPTSQERWSWVRAGYELLRDEGLRYNPRDPELYWELGWIFSHKIGGITDDFHLYYKERLAYEMMVLLGPDRITNEDLTALALAPRTWDELVEDPNVLSVVQALRTVQPEWKTAKAFQEGYLTYCEAGLSHYLRLEDKSQRFSPELFQAIQAQRGNPGMARLDIFIRAQQLRNAWKLEPERMAVINERYGPVDYEDETRHESLDWRLPWSHAIYWAFQGLPHAKERSFDWITLQRMIYHGLQDLFHHGNLQIISIAPPADIERQPGQEIVDKVITTGRLALYNSQDLRMFPIAYQSTLDIIEAFREVGERDPGGILGGSINLGRAGVVNLYLAGHRKMAQRYLNHLRGRQPENQAFQGTLEEYVRSYLKEEISNLSPQNARNYVNGLLRDSWARYGMHDDENSAIREAWAGQILREYGRQFANPEDRILLPDHEHMKWTALMDLLADAAVSPLAKDLVLQRIQIENPELFPKIMAELMKQEKPQDESKAPKP